VNTTLRTWFTAAAAFVLVPVLTLGACSDDSADTAPGGGGQGQGGTGNGGGGAEDGICLLNNCSADDQCVGCADGRNTCLVEENRCVACDPNTGEGCADGEECSPFGICVPQGLTCPTESDGTPTVVCEQNSDCLACSPLHQVCDTDTHKCQACTETNTQHCLSSDICIDTDGDTNAETCSPKCPATCTVDNDCGQCGGTDPANMETWAHACNAHTCAECSDTFPCASDKECVNGTCQKPCGILGAPAGTCEAAADCSACGDGDDQWECRTPINDPSHGTCVPPVEGCSDLGDFAVLPEPYSDVTNLCSDDGDCAGVGILFNVGEQIRDLIGGSELDLGFTTVEIHDANVEYAMPICAEIPIVGDLNCGVCVPCETDADCQPIDVDPLFMDLFAGEPVAQIAAALLADLLWGSNDDHNLNFFCQEVIAGYGACIPCANPLSACGATGGGGGGMGCSHDVCDEGDALDPSCNDDCAEAVCNEDSYCCTTAWDATCVGEADQYCADICTSGDPCSMHDECTEGPALTPGCSPCAADICAFDAWCCDQEWDSVCVGYTDPANADYQPSCGSAC
jgi:hypothetical protein